MAAPTKIQIILEAVNKANAELRQVAQQVQGLEAAGKASASGLAESAAAAKKLEGALEEVGKGAEQIERVAEVSVTAAQQSAGAVENLGAAAVAAAQEMQALETAGQASASGLAESTTATEKLDDALQEVGKGVAQIKQAGEASVAAAEQSTAAVEDLTAAVGDATQGMQELDKAGKTSGEGVKKSDQAVMSLENALGGLKRQMAAAFSVVVIVNFIRQTLNAVDQMKKFGEEVGFTLNKLAGYQFGAELSNIGSGQFQQGLRTFTGNVAEAADASSRAAQIFRSMGIAVADTAGELRPVEAVFDDVADAFSTYADGAAKAELAQQLFGVRSARFINLLNGGKAGLQAYTEEFERLTGVSMEEAARNAEEFNDSITRLKTVLSGAALQLSNALLPAITEFIRLASEIIRTTGPAFKLVFEGIGFAMKGLAGIAIALNGALENVMTSVATYTQASTELIKGNVGTAKSLLEGLDEELETNRQNTQKRLEALFGLKAKLDAEEGGQGQVPGGYFTRLNYLQARLAEVQSAASNQLVMADAQDLDVTRARRIAYLEQERELLKEIQDELPRTPAALGAGYTDTEANAEYLAIIQQREEILNRLVQIDREIRDQTVLQPGVFSQDRSVPFEQRMAAYNQPTLEGQGGSLGNSLGAGLENFTAGLGNNASKVQQFFGAINGEIRNVAANITQAAFVTREWGKVWSGLGLMVIQTLIEIGIQSAIQYTLRAAMRQAETADEITHAGIRTSVHGASETTKTGVTLGQSLGRRAIWLGETIFHGIQAVIRTAAHVASEVFMTGITIIQAAIRMASVLAEAAVYIILAAVKAMSAVASIPYVGPFLAVAALAAILAAGAGAMGAFKKGGYTGDGDSNEVAGFVHKKEFVFDEASTAAIGPAQLASMAAAAKAGRPLPTMNPSAAPAVQMGGSTSAGGSAAAAPMNVSFATLNTRQDKREFMRREGIKMVVDYQKKRGMRV